MISDHFDNFIFSFYFSMCFDKVGDIDSDSVSNPFIDSRSEIGSDNNDSDWHPDKESESKR